MNYQSVLNANREYHDLHAKDYNEVTLKGNFTRVEQMFSQFKGKRFLDMGCGTGEQLKVALKYFEMVYGVDCSPGMLEIAKTITPHVKQEDIANTSFQSGYFDFINCFSVLHHLYEQEPVIQEAYRLLKEGGLFYSDNDPNRKFYEKFGWWLFIRRKLFKKKIAKELRELEQIAEYHQKDGLDPDEIIKKFTKAGFKRVLVQYHYPEKPDLFTKILTFLNSRFFKSRNFCYYFSVFAKK